MSGERFTQVLGMYMFMRMWGQEVNLGCHCVVCQMPSTSFYEAVSLIGLELGWLVSEPQGANCLCFTGSGITSAHYHTRIIFFKCDFWELNLALQVCVSGTLILCVPLLAGPLRERM